MSVPMHPSDPAYFLLADGIADPSKRSTSTVHSSTCYICRDPEYALMGLPLCFPCSKCGGHVPADDSVCSDCKYDQQDDIPEQTLEEQARIRAETDQWLASMEEEWIP